MVNSMKITLSFRHFMAETYGTFVVVFLGTLTYVMVVSTNPLLALVLSAVAYGTSYIAMHYTLSHISGAHFNPIITIAAREDGRLSMKQALNYIVAQLFGALAAGLMVFWVASLSPLLTYQVLGFRTLSPLDTPAIPAMIIEMFIGFFVVYVYLAVSRRRLASWTGLSVGLMMSISMLSVGLLTGGHANPARSVATLLFMGSDGLQQIAAYVVAPIVGALLARMFYKYLKFEDQHDVA
jgi:aquaporin Z